MTEPLVSVIIPVYNGARFIRQAIDSVLSQIYPAVEVVVVNDGSTDESLAIAEDIAQRDARVRVVHKRNGGLSAARNTGIEHARGGYLTFLDADDWILPHKICGQMDVLRARPDVDFVYSDYHRVNDADGTVFELYRGVPPVPFPDILVYRNWLGVMASLLRRRLVERVGQFDPALRASEDRDYWYRCAQHTKFVYAPGIVGMRRLHGNQMTGDNDRMTQAQRQFAAKHFADDRLKLRSNMTAFHLARAMHDKQSGAYARCALHLARFAASANSLAEARFVWNLVRAPMVPVGKLRLVLQSDMGTTSHILNTNEPPGARDGVA
jgi:glycosyltransferase involved in cell wall biosynthesis